ncbi:hypothetical protein Nhal_1727 [Nitrosococcus halophilus Nc 4]|uniref:Uncharacterized protein n=2 Tax=Nitrosococcus halophilus TaxID=133539 RepID=D5C2J2_NITHN|nr:hypothetical protein Nhal_1727 [Nitrosococcus halophilus Nc 4]
MGPSFAFSPLESSRLKAGLIPATVSMEESAPAKESKKLSPQPYSIEQEKKTQRGYWVEVAGYGDSRYVYGQLQILGRGEVAGYLYQNASRQIYVVGEIVGSKRFLVRDTAGVIYRLRETKGK